MLAPKIDLAPNSIPTGTQSPYATIVAVHCSGTSCETVQDIGIVGLPAELSYRVAINSADGSGPMIFDNVKPANRRPNVKVIAAQPQDKCLAVWEGLSVYFLIIEPPYFKDCQA